MIKINLLGQKKKFKMPVVLGMDLAQLNLKMFVVAIILYNLPETILMPILEKEISEKKVTLAKERKKLKVVELKLKKHKNVKGKLDAFNKQLVKLKLRSEQVDTIVRKRSNPKLLLERFARSIPDDLWFNTLEIDNNQNILILGGAISYKSIGDFIISGNESGFFGNTLSLKTSKTVEDGSGSRQVRVQEFEISGKIQTYNPWVK